MDVSFFKLRVSLPTQLWVKVCLKKNHTIKLNSILHLYWHFKRPLLFAPASKVQVWIWVKVLERSFFSPPPWALIFLFMLLFFGRGNTLWLLILKLFLVEETFGNSVRSILIFVFRLQILGDKCTIVGYGLIIIIKIKVEILHIN